MREALYKRTIAEHVKSLATGEYTAVELTRSYLERIAECEPTVGAFLTVDEVGALQVAAESDARRALGQSRGALDGIPFAVKDNFCTAGLRTTCAARILEDFVPPYDATAVKKLKDAGCILLGKLNLDEFAMGSSTETSALGVTRNPLNPAYVPGGSSGGSAAAVAAFEAPFTLGSDTGGSVRQPAAFCGIVGMKPTYGAISRYGMIAHASSLDCVGILTQNAEDCALVLEALAGRDIHDATAMDPPRRDFARPIRAEGKPLRIAVVRELLRGDAVLPEVAKATEDAVARLCDCGAMTGEVSLPAPALALAAYCVVSSAEASSNLARYDGVHFGKRSQKGETLEELYANSRAEGFGNETKRRVLFGTYMLTEKNRALYYDRALMAREQIRLALAEILKEYDLILTPTIPTGAFRRGSSHSQEVRRRADLCAVYASLAGLPAVSVPFGYNSEGMPLGIQLAGAPFSEGLLLHAAKILEEVRV